MCLLTPANRQSLPAAARPPGPPAEAGNPPRRKWSVGDRAVVPLQLLPDPGKGADHQVMIFNLAQAADGNEPTHRLQSVPVGIQEGVQRNAVRNQHELSGRNIGCGRLLHGRRDADKTGKLSAKQMPQQIRPANRLAVHGLHQRNAAPAQSHPDMKRDLFQMCVDDDGTHHPSQARKRLQVDR